MFWAATPHQCLGSSCRMRVWCICATLSPKKTARSPSPPCQVGATLWWVKPFPFFLCLGLLCKRVDAIWVLGTKWLACGLGNVLFSSYLGWASDPSVIAAKTQAFLFKISSNYDAVSLSLPEPLLDRLLALMVEFWYWLFLPDSVLQGGEDYFWRCSLQTRLYSGTRQPENWGKDSLSSGGTGVRVPIPEHKCCKHV